MDPEHSDLGLHCLSMLSALMQTVRTQIRVCSRSMLFVKEAFTKFQQITKHVNVKQHLVIPLGA